MTTFQSTRDGILFHRHSDREALEEMEVCASQRIPLVIRVAQPGQLHEIILAQVGAEPFPPCAAKDSFEQIILICLRERANSLDHARSHTEQL